MFESSSQLSSTQFRSASFVDYKNDSQYKRSQVVDAKSFTLIIFFYIRHGTEELSLESIGISFLLFN